MANCLVLTNKTAFYSTKTPFCKNKTPFCFTETAFWFDCFLFTENQSFELLFLVGLFSRLSVTFVTFISETAFFFDTLTFVVAVNDCIAQLVSLNGCKYYVCQQHNYASQCDVVLSFVTHFYIFLVNTIRITRNQS